MGTFGIKVRIKIIQYVCINNLLHYTGMLTDSSKFLTEARNIGNRDKDIS